MSEPTITINGHRLTFSQSATVRVAIQNFATDLQADGLGDDEHGKVMCEAYLQRIREINHLMRI